MEVYDEYNEKYKQNFDNFLKIISDDSIEPEELIKIEEIFLKLEFTKEGYDSRVNANIPKEHKCNWKKIFNIKNFYIIFKLNLISSFKDVVTSKDKYKDLFRELKEYEDSYRNNDKTYSLEDEVELYFYIKDYNTDNSMFNKLFNSSTKLEENYYNSNKDESFVVFRKFMNYQQYSNIYECCKCNEDKYIELFMPITDKFEIDCFFNKYNVNMNNSNSLNKNLGNIQNMAFPQTINVNIENFQSENFKETLVDLFFEIESRKEEKLNEEKLKKIEREERVKNLIISKEEKIVESNIPLNNNIKSDVDIIDISEIECIDFRFKVDENSRYLEYAIDVLNLDPSKQVTKEFSWHEFFTKILANDQIPVYVDFETKKRCRLFNSQIKKDKFSEYEFDNFFGILNLEVVLKEGIEKKFSKIWKVRNLNNENFKIVVSTIEKVEEFAYDVNTPIEEFVKKLNKNYPEKKFANFLKEMKEQSVNTANDLIKIDSVYINQKFYGLSHFILEELDKYKMVKYRDDEKIFYDKDFVKYDENIDNRKVVKNNRLYEAYLYKIKRFFYYNLGKKSLSYIDADVAHKSNEFIKIQYKNDKILNQLKKFYNALTSPENETRNSKMKRGILFHGPPGTGKTDISVMFPELLGFNSICKGLSSTELNRSLVGETEALITCICERARLYPHLICFITVDEIEALVPKRDDKENRNKGDIVNTLLSLIEGGNDVKNLIFIGSTNYLKKIDDAWLRRMSEKIFCPRMSSEDRKRLLNEKINKCLIVDNILKSIDDDFEKYTQKLNKDCFFEDDKLYYEEKLIALENRRKNIQKSKDKNYTYVKVMSDESIDKFNSYLINFTAAAIIALSQSIVELGRNEEITKENEDSILDFIIKVSYELKIKFGSLSLTEIIKNNKYLMNKFEETINCEDIIPINQNLQGLILVDFANKELKFATKPKDKLIYYEIKISKFFPGVSEAEFGGKNQIPWHILYPFFAMFAYHKFIKIDSLQLINSAYLNGEKATEDKEMIEKIQEITDELKMYDKSMLVLDFDSLAGCIPSVSSSSMGDSHSYNLQNPKMFKYILDFTKNCKYSPKEMFWTIVLAKEKYIHNLIKNDLGIEESKSYLEREEKIKRENFNLECLRCHNKFNLDSNIKHECKVHKGYVFDKKAESWTLLDYYDENDLLMIESMNNDEDMKYDFMSENFSVKSEKNKEDKKDTNDNDRYFYVCCPLERFTKVASSPCTHINHISNKIDFMNERKKFKQEMDILLTNRINLRNNNCI